MNMKPSKSISQKTNTNGKAVAKKPVKSKLIKKLDVVFSEYVRKRNSVNGKAVVLLVVR